MTDSLTSGPLSLAAGRTPECGTPARERTLVDVFAATVARHSDRVALDAPDATLSYGELDVAVRALAARLRAAGLGPGDRIGVYVPSGTAELYIAILGVLHAGAAYVPVDAADSPGRASALWESAGACAVLRAGAELSLTVHPEGAARAAEPADDAWIIFTSGSSGRPKAVAVSHRAAAAFVDAEAELWSVHCDDRVLAGLSVSFDASCEEMWQAWRHGAALVPAPRALVRAAADLGPWLADRRISVISTVPTLAAMWREEDLAGVRLLILGGEACPAPLAWRLAREREVWNTYGPTEATVVSTAARMRPGEPVLIGWPLTGWEIAIVDDSGRPVSLGEEGQLVISGVGLGRYLDPTLDAERYAPLPALGPARAYRTGDLVRETLDGLEFVGRGDDQVKLGARRLELGEVDAHLQAVPGVVAAAAAVHKTPSGNPLLVGYVVGDVQAEHVRAAAAERLPHGVTPLVVVLDALPLSAAGKVDRKALPWPPPSAPRAGGEAGLTGTAAWLSERWVDELGPLALDGHSDFFALGGSSLSAAKLVTRLRERYPTLAVADLYVHRRLGELARYLDGLKADPAPAAPAVVASSRCFGLGQLLGVLVLVAITAVPLLVAVLAYGDLAGRTGLPHVGWAWLVVTWLALATPPARLALYVLVRRILLGTFQPGRYPRHSWLAYRLWFLERLSALTHAERVAGTPWVDRYARMLGADVGVGARLGTVPPAGALVHLGPGATVESSVDMHGWWIDGQELVVGEIWIGAGARVGTRSLLEPGCVVGEGAEIEPGSVVSGHVPPGEHWGGAPAAYIGPAGGSWPAEPPQPSRRPALWRAAFALSMPVEAVIEITAVTPALSILWRLRAPELTLHIGVGWLAAYSAIIVGVSTPLLAILIALTLRAVWRLARPGWYADDGAVGWALWFGEDLKNTASEVLFPLYASLFTAPWLRLAGIRVGRRAELSTSTGLNRSVSIGALSQATDDIGFSGVRARAGGIQVEPVTVGERTFLGPGAILRGGTALGPDSLLGVMTLSPLRPPSGTSWLGVPPLELPRVPATTDPGRTTTPPRRLVAARAAMDLLRIFGPNTLLMFIGLLDLLAFEWLGSRLGLLALVVLAPMVVLASGLLATAITVALKWLVIGRYRPGAHPLWSFFVWRDELINTAQEQLAGALLLEHGLGTPLMALYMRAMGSRVGRGTWIETTAVTEYDMVELGDGAAVNRGACLMTHLFHDRTLRIGPTRIGRGATLGPTAVVLPDTELGDGVTLAGHSVVLRGESLPPGTRWHGTPVISG